MANADFENANKALRTKLEQITLENTKLKAEIAELTQIFPEATLVPPNILVDGDHDFPEVS